MDTIQLVINNSTEFISNGGILVGFFLVFLECFIPALPLSVFIALNVNAFGFIPGILISWIATCLGSFICYSFFSYLGRRLSKKFLKKKTVKKVRRAIKKFEKISFTGLVLVITLPFTPSFLINILGGLTEIKREKFMFALLIGKLFAVIFWGYIGKSFIESLTDLKSLIYIFVTLLIAYIISKIVSKKMNIE